MKHFLFLFVFALGITSCGKKEEDHYAREQKEIDEYLSSEALNVYKAFKVCLRGTKATGQDSAFDRARRQLLELSGYVLEKAADTTHRFTTEEAAGVITEAKPAIAELLKKDEDSLPTVMENIAFSLNTPAQDTAIPLLTASEEHLILSGLWYINAHAYPGLALYEIHRVHTADVRGVHLKCLAELCRSTLYLSNKWPYHAEKNADDFLALTESEKEALLANPWPAINAQGKKATPEQSWHQQRAIGFALRSAARMQCDNDDKKEEAFDDLSTFVEEAEAGGLDHEAVDLAGLLVALKKDDNDAALVYIGKLEQRTYLPTEIKDLLAKVKTEITEKKNEDAQKTLEEHSLLSRCAGRLFRDQFMNLPAVKKLNASDAGKKFISITTIKTDQLMPGKNLLDSLQKSAKGLIDKVF